MKKTLNQLAHVSAGYSFRGKIANESDGVASVIQMRDISKDGIIHWETVVKTNAPLNKLNDSSEVWLKGGD
ncbi:MAG: hypothetical protein Q9M19_00715, partial [Mariprofundaceae bacterium]|nr:hypothetical protein [Mariprofundaceae bacterium]